MMMYSVIEIERDVEHEVHAAGCADLKRGPKAMLDSWEYDAVNADSAVNMDREALDRDFPGLSDSVYYRVMPCACGGHE